MNAETSSFDCAAPSVQTPHPGLLKRKIIHFDMDCFYAAVEVRDNPILAGKPVIVGGSPESRGVVCTASYEARRFGVHSAMPCAHAKRLCPEAIFIKPNFKRYQAASAQIREIFQRFTTQIEPLSLDEAYLDVTDNKQGLYAVKIARLIQNAIIAEVGLTGSAGIAPNKLIAKIASDYRKPKGLTVVTPENVTTFMQHMPLRKISGIGPASEKRLSALGFTHCQDIWPHRLGDLQTQLGKRMGLWLYWRARGIDERAVQVSRIRKSLGKEDTFVKDTNDPYVLEKTMAELAQQISSRLKQQNLQGQTVTLKIKYHNFQQITRSHTLPNPVQQAQDILSASFPLLQKTEAARRKVRLVGITISKLSQTSSPSEKQTLQPHCPA
jgi:DNA polymerase-4